VLARKPGFITTSVDAGESGRRAQAQSRRARFARGLTFSEFGYRHGRALDYENFRDRRPCDSPRPSPEHRMLARRWPSWP
jgi:hypothetical protein